MKFYFDTINGFGHITHTDFIYNPIVFVPEQSDNVEDWLSMGLLPDEATRDGSEWFACRSCRLDVTKFEPTKTSKKMSRRVVSKVVYYKDLNNYYIAFINHIYQQYCEKKEYNNSFSIENLIHNNSHEKVFIFYYYEETIIGFVVCRRINKSLISLQFATDYSQPKLSLGNVSQLFEIEFCKENNIDYCYLMPGYETSCLYKADFKGVEFYTGTEWSKDSALFKLLMINDSKVHVNDNRA